MSYFTHYVSDGETTIALRIQPCENCGAACYSATMEIEPTQIPVMDLEYLEFPPDDYETHECFP